MIIKFYYFIRKFFLIMSLFFLQNIIAKEVKIIYSSSIPDVTKTKNGSYPHLLSLLKKYREKGNVLFLFGGNSLGPSLISYMDKGAHIIDILNILEPDAYSINKREFVFSVDELSLRTFDAIFPFVLSNVKYGKFNNKFNDKIDGISKNLLIKKSNINFGIISILEKEAKQEYGIDEIEISDIEKSVRENVKKLKKKGADLIILFTSNPLEISDKFLDEKLVDLVLSKNEYIKKEKIKIKNKNHVFLNDLDKVAIININKKNKKYNFDIKKESLLKYKKDKKLDKLIIDYEKRLNVFMNEKIGITNTLLNTNRIEVRTKENLFANLVTDAIKDYTNSDISFINGGTIRGNKIYQPKYTIIRKDIIEELPFRNKVVLLEIKGSNIIKALENGLSLVESNKGRFPHISGLKVVYDSTLPSGKRIKKVSIGLKELEKNKIYKLATSDYLYSGGDGYSMFKDSKLVKYHKSIHRLISSIVIDYIIYKKNLNLKNEKRLIDLAKKK